MARAALECSTLARGITHLSAKEARCGEEKQSSESEAEVHPRDRRINYRSRPVRQNQPLLRDRREWGSGERRWCCSHNAYSDARKVRTIGTLPDCVGSGAALAMSDPAARRIRARGNRRQSTSVKADHRKQPEMRPLVPPIEHSIDNSIEPFDSPLSAWQRACRLS
jgi:hypothetical protein